MAMESLGGHAPTEGFPTVPSGKYERRPYSLTPDAGRTIAAWQRRSLTSQGKPSRTRSGRVSLKTGEMGCEPLSLITLGMYAFLARVAGQSNVLERTSNPQVARSSRAGGAIRRNRLGCRRPHQRDSCRMRSCPCDSGLRECCATDVCLWSTRVASPRSAQQS